MEHLTKDEIVFLLQAVAMTPIKAGDAKAVIVLVDKLNSIAESLSLSETEAEPDKAKPSPRTKK
jgi:hypothetical protein